MCTHLRNFILKLRFLSLSNILKNPCNILRCTFSIIKLKEYKRIRGLISSIKAEHTLFSHISLSYTIQKSDVLGQELANIFYKGPDILGFVGLRVSFPTLTLQCESSYIHT